MAVAYADFLARFPEFEPAPKAMVEAALSEARRNVDAEVFGDKTDDAIRWKAAHLLAISPFGQQARLISKDGSTTYGKYFWELAKSVTPGFRVA
jgi:hypothetical protein